MICFHQAHLLLSATATFLLFLRLIDADQELSFVLEPFDSVRNSWDVEVYNNQGYLVFNTSETEEGYLGKPSLKVDFEVSAPESSSLY